MIREKKKYHINTHALSFFFFFFISFSLCCTSQCLLKQPIMLPLQEAATDLPAALFLFGFVNRVFQGPCHQIWNRNCSLISLEAGWRCSEGKLPPSITPLCSLFSSERITSFTHPLCLHLRASFQGRPWYKHTETYDHDMLYAHTHVYGEENGGGKTPKLQPRYYSYICSLM